MATKRRKKKSKVLYHRVVLLIILLLLIIYLMITGGKMVYDFFNPSEVSSETVENQEITKIEVEENQKVVVIDAGHGGYDPGSSALDGTLEKDITLNIALKVGAYIESQRDDVKVLYIREDDDYYWTEDNQSDLFYRVNTAIENDAALFLSIHLNSHEENEPVTGHETWVSMTSEANQIFANEVDAALNALDYNPCRGIKDEAESNLLVLHYNTVPSVLVELGYINSESDFGYINSNNGSTQIARALGDAMIKTLDQISD